jgi:hypothetical protein
MGARAIHLLIEQTKCLLLMAQTLKLTLEWLNLTLFERFVSGNLLHESKVCEKSSSFDLNARATAIVLIAISIVFREWSFMIHSRVAAALTHWSLN